MNRKDWIWVAVKTFGLYLLIQALLAIPPLASTYYVATRELPGGMRRTLNSELMIPLWQQAATFFILVNLGLYLLKSGRLVYLLIGRSLPPQDSVSGNAQNQT